ncbi:MAG: recombinase family protein [Chloracidobacterium sp.]|nr:recombinase family protein [Chloracidobacterium sp.]
MNKTEQIRSRGGAAPFGYRWRDGRLEIDETEAPIRRLIFDLFLKHRRKKTVALILNDLGYRTRNRAEFSDMAIDRLLRDTTAKGVRREIDADIQVDPIVSIEVWERANTLLGTREVKQPVNLFAGRVSCSCGGVMNVPSNSTKYVCPRCRIKIPSDDLESVFLSQLEPFRIGSHTLSESWATFNLKNKRLIVEHLCEAVTVARESISIRFACDPSLLKTAALGQPMQPGLDGHLEQPPSNIPQEPLNEPLLSEAEAAIFLGISKSTLLRKRNAGLIGFFQVGFRILYSKEKHLMPYLTSCEGRR